MPNAAAHAHPPRPAPAPGGAGGRCGFTIVELLVVVAVLALLGMLVVPVTLRVRAVAGQVRCESNLHQWTLAAIDYASQHDGRLPRRGQGTQITSVVTRPEDWFNARPPLMNMEPYSALAARHEAPRAEDRRVWSCAEAIDLGAANFFSYAMNMRLSTWLSPDPDHIRRVGPLSTMVFMADAPVDFCSTLPTSAPYSPVARHAGRVNLSFLDGHVAAYTGADVGCGIGDPMRSDVRWVVPGSVWNGPAN
jgi:prepilin-type processing-associated H-X9-DG protein/prepilin-type N-terminal cleavage/methylation domain-containing protein